jgi:hypothetical protein
VAKLKHNISLEKLHYKFMQIPSENDSAGFSSKRTILLGMQVEAAAGSVG